MEMELVIFAVGLLTINFFEMEYQKDFYEALKRFLEEVIRSGRLHWDKAEGYAVVGDYWLAVCDYLYTRDMAHSWYGELDIKQTEFLIPIVAECRSRLKVWRSQKWNRITSTSGNILAMLFGALGFLTSLLSIYISYSAK